MAQRPGELGDSIVAILDSGGVRRGTGFFVTSEGLLVTCSHVAEQCGTAIFVQMANGDTPLPGQVEKKSRDYDLALLKVDLAGCPALPLSIRWLPGDVISSHGHSSAYSYETFPQGVPMPPAVLAGRIRARGRHGELDCLLIADAEIASGMSGAPAVNAKGQVIGVISLQLQPLVPSDMPGELRQLAAHLGRRHALAIPTTDLLHLDPQLLPQRPAALREPYMPLPTTAPPSAALQAEYAVVPFRGRDSRLEQLHEWCRNSIVASAKLIVGPGGTGKTRLAAEIADRLDQRSWVTGFLRTEVDESPRSLDSLVGDGRHMLIVVDYAETRPQVLKALLLALVERNSEVKLRLLLLARSGAGAWWQAIVSSDTRYKLAIPDPPEVIELEQLEATEHNRKIAFAEAVSAFAHLLRVSPGQAEPPPMKDDMYATVLAIHLAAYLSVHPLIEQLDGNEALPNLMRHMLEHEERYWNDTAPRLEPPVTRQLLRDLVAAVTLCGASSEAEAIALITRLPGLTGTHSTSIRALAQWLRSLYPSQDGYVGALQPDRLGEYLVTTAISDQDDGANGERLPDVLLRPVRMRERLIGRRRSPARALVAGQRRRAERALTVLDRVSRNDQRLYQIIKDLLHRHSYLRAVAANVAFGASRDAGGLSAGLSDYRVDPRPHNPWRRRALVAGALTALVTVGTTMYMVGRGRQMPTGPVAPAAAVTASPSPNSSATAAPSPSVTAPSPAATVFLPGGPAKDGRVVYRDAFSGTEKLEPGEPGNVNGQFVFSDGAQSHNSPGPPFPIDPSLRVQIEFGTLSDGWMDLSLAFGRHPYSGEKGGEYELSIDTDGSWEISRLHHDFVRDPPITSRTSLAKGTGLPVRRAGDVMSLEILAAGSGNRLLQAFLNDRKFAAVVDAEPLNVGYDTYSLSAYGSARAYFDNLVVTKL